MIDSKDELAGTEGVGRCHLSCKTEKPFSSKPIAVVAQHTATPRLARKENLWHQICGTSFSRHMQLQHQLS